MFEVISRQTLLLIILSVLFGVMSGSFYYSKLINFSSMISRLTKLGYLLAALIIGLFLGLSAINITQNAEITLADVCILLVSPEVTHIVIFTGVFSFAGLILGMMGAFTQWFELECEPSPGTLQPEMMVNEKVEKLV